MKLSALLPLTLFIIIAAFFAWRMAGIPPKKTDPMIGKTAHELDVTAIQEDAPNPKPLSQFKGKTVLLNFFASWCVPCLAEHPVLLTLSNTHGVTLYGVAWNDDARNTQAWLDEHGNPYDVTGLDISGQTGVEYGITGVPESFLIDAEGLIRWRWSGPLTEDVVQRELMPLLPE